MFGYSRWPTRRQDGRCPANGSRIFNYTDRKSAATSRPHGMRAGSISASSAVSFNEPVLTSEGRRQTYLLFWDRVAVLFLSRTNRSFVISITACLPVAPTSLRGSRR